MIPLKARFGSLNFIMNLQLFVSWCLCCNHSTFKLSSTDSEALITMASTLWSLQRSKISSIDSWSQKQTFLYGELFHYCLTSHLLQQQVPALIHGPHFCSSLAHPLLPHQLPKGNSRPFLSKGEVGIHSVIDFTQRNKIKWLFLWAIHSSICKGESSAYNTLHA